MMYTYDDITHYMSRALQLAEQALISDDVPVGAVIVYENHIIAEAFNTREKEKNALHHAEIKAINDACKTLGGWRLHKCDMFVTLEPCMMCAGAIINARINRVFYGAEDVKAGGFGSVVDLTQYPFNHTPKVIGGILADRSSELLSEFFKKLRNR